MTAIKVLIEYCKLKNVTDDVVSQMHTLVPKRIKTENFQAMIVKAEAELKEKDLTSCPFCSGAIKPCTGEFVNALLVNALKYLTREQFNALTAALYYRSDFQKEREAELLEEFKFNSALVLKFKNTLVLENVQGNVNKRLNEGKG